MTAVRVIMAAELSDSEKKKIEIAWLKKTGGVLRPFVYEIDENLIGGIRIEDGTEIFDASVKGQLARIRKQF